jgi:hypothetical protein
MKESYLSAMMTPVKVIYEELDYIALENQVRKMKEEHQNAKSQ